MSEDKLQADIARGAQAAALLENVLLAETFARLEADYIAAWKTWAASDTEGRERLWVAVNVLGKVQDHIRRVLSDGRLAQRHLHDLAVRTAR